MPRSVRFSESLLGWYRSAKRDLPWRDIQDPYAIWISEIMLQQTRVSVVIPYYLGFLRRFPDLASLANAPEPDLLASWSGLGYYSRARNLQKAARQADGTFPQTYDGIRALPGVGDYTAAAVASIAFGVAHPALDGNVLRVLSRVSGDAGNIRTPATRRRLREFAETLLDPNRPGDFNQAMMELGATICLPRNPKCLLCPVARHCTALRTGKQNELPLKAPRPPRIRSDRTLLVIEKGGRCLMWKEAGFWGLPEPKHLPEAWVVEGMGVFRHSITKTDYTFSVQRAEIGVKPSGFDWIPMNGQNPLINTTTRKALTVWHKLMGQRGNPI